MVARFKVSTIQPMKSAGSGWECLEIEVHEYIAAVNLKKKKKVGSAEIQTQSLGFRVQRCESLGMSL